MSTKYKSQRCWSHFKSSINPEDVLVGRPHGGVGWICKYIPNVTYKVMEIDNERICGVQLFSNGQLKINFIGVYLPFYNGTMDQIELYGETLQCLQVVLDSHEGEPLVIVGDMNASLPQQQTLTCNWHRLRPFNAHSLILYDFLCDNELCIANFGFKQPCNHTYFKGSNCSYIDHVFIPRYLNTAIVSCDIINDCPVNTSDHFPIKTCINIHMEDVESINDLCGNKMPVFPKINWSDCEQQVTYSEFVNNAASQLIKSC